MNPNASEWSALKPITWNSLSFYIDLFPCTVHLTERKKIEYLLYLIIFLLKKTVDKVYLVLLFKTIVHHVFIFNNKIQVHRRTEKNGCLYDKESNPIHRLLGDCSTSEPSAVLLRNKQDILVWISLTLATYFFHKNILFNLYTNWCCCRWTNGLLKMWSLTLHIKKIYWY